MVVGRAHDEIGGGRGRDGKRSQGTRERQLRSCAKPVFHQTLAHQDCRTWRTASRTFAPP